MSSYHAWTHSEKGDGGTDPIKWPPLAYLDDWDFEGDGALIPTDTWADVANASSPPDIRYFTEVFKADASWGHIFDAGQLSRLDAAVYEAHGMVTFGGDVDDDDNLKLGINFGAAIRHVFDVTARDNSIFRVTGSAVHFGNLSTFPASLSVWHDHGSDITLTSARLLVIRHRLLSSGGFENRA